MSYCERKCYSYLSSWNIEQPQSSVAKTSKQTLISYLELAPVTALEDGGSGYRHLQELVGCDRVLYLGILRFCYLQLLPNGGTTSRGRSVIINNNGEFLSVT